MPPFERVCAAVWRSEAFWRKVLIGGLLSFVPVLNIFALGYLVRYARQVVRGRTVRLPAWPEPKEWPMLFAEGLALVVLWLVWVGLPTLVVWLLTAPLGLILGLGGLEIGSFFPIAFLALFGAWLGMMPLAAFVENDDLGAAFRFGKLLDCGFPVIRYAIPPSLALAGMILAGWLVYGLAVFFGLIMVCAYYMLLLPLAKEHREIQF